MRYISGILLLLFSVVLLLSSCENKNDDSIDASKGLPNVLFILADDLGYGELGVYGQSLIETPHIDQLAKDGMRFTQHYSGSPVCAPSRYTLLSGKHTGNAYIRGNAEWGSRGNVWSYTAMIQDSTLEGQRPIPSNTPLMSKMFQEAGYRTGIVGKWGLGAPHTESIPNKQGFDFFYGYNCQRQAHTYYPVHLYKNESRVYLANDTIMPHQRFPEGEDLNDSTLYQAYTGSQYAPSLMLDEMMGFLEEAAIDTVPFFLYYATPLPHVGLQAPQRWVDYYVEKWGDEEAYPGDKGYVPSRYPNATYAAMISYLDEQVGDLIQALKENGQYENTLIVFTSDNGPTYAGGVNPVHFQSAGPFASESGKGKGSVYEGGIRVPLIVSWHNRIAKNTQTHHPSVFYDFVPTFQDILASDYEIASDGLSFMHTLLGDSVKQDEHDFLYWEFPEYRGQLAVRFGDWKYVGQNLSEEGAYFELYNLHDDPFEKNDVLGQNPEIQAHMDSIIRMEHTRAELERFHINYLDNE